MLIHVQGNETGHMFTVAAVNIVNIVSYVAIASASQVRKHWPTLAFVENKHYLRKLWAKFHSLL